MGISRQKHRHPPPLSMEALRLTAKKIFDTPASGCYTFAEKRELVGGLRGSNFDLYNLIWVMPT